MPLFHRLPIVVLLSALSLLPACSSSTSVGMVIPPGATATGSITGRLPVVEIRNDGPEWVEASMKTVDGEGFDGRLGPGGSAMHKLPGPLTVRLENKGDQQATVRVEAEGADGLSLILQPRK